MLSGVFTFPVIVHRVGASSMFLLKTYGSFGMFLLHSAENGMAIHSALGRMSMDRAIESDMKKHHTTGIFPTVYEYIVHDF